MKKTFAIYLCLLCITGICAQQPVHVIITAGQSNTDGRVSNRLLPPYIKALATDTADFEKGAYRFCKISQNRNDGAFVPYFPKGRITNGLWTYDAVVYSLLEQAWQSDFYVVKYAVGGTSIQYPNDTTKGRFWSANPEWLANTASCEKKGKSLLLSFTESIDAAIDNTLSKIEGGYQIDAFLWHQGESDHRYPDKYYGNLKAMIAHVRKHLTEKTGKDYSRLPFIFGSVPNRSRQYAAGVDKAMRRIADEDRNAYLIDMANGELQRDRLHFNEKSAEYLGQEMYKIMDKILNLNRFGFRVAKYRGDKTAAISYTFDDGLREHYTLVAPAFKKLGFKGTFWINGSKINRDASAITDTTRMTWQNLREMSRQGHEISNHGWAHKNFGRHTFGEIKEDISRNDSALFAATGIMPRTFCYPNNNKSNAEAFEFANKNRVGSRTEQFSVGGKSTHDNLEKRVAALLADREWGVTMTHGINYGYDHFGNPGIFWEHLRKVKAQENKIWVGTFCEITAYVKERKALTFTITPTEKGFTVVPELNLDKNLFGELLTGIIERKDIKKAIVRQGKKKLKTLISTDKVIFDFDPFGENIYIEIQKN